MLSRTNILRFVSKFSELNFINLICYIVMLLHFLVTFIVGGRCGRNKAEEKGCSFQEGYEEFLKVPNLDGQRRICQKSTNESSGVHLVIVNYKFVTTEIGAQHRCLRRL